jgi:hypothetical protein
MFASGTAMAIVLALDLFVVGGALDALYRQGTFGPLDFTHAKTPKRPLDVTLLRARWIAAGLLLNGVISWALAAAMLCPATLTERWLPRFARRSNVAIALGLAAAALGASQFDFGTRALVAWIPIAFLGLALAGASALRAADPGAFGRVATVAAVATLAAIYVPPLLADPMPLDLLFAEDMAFEMLQAQLFVFSGLLLLRVRRTAAGLQRGMLLLGALGFFFVGGEEISWGQRILGFDTPEFWANNQDETTIHNIPALDSWMNLRPALYAWAALSALAHFAPALRRALAAFAIPVVPAIGWLAVTAALLAHNRALHRWYGNADEAQETFAAIAFTTAALAAYYASLGKIGVTPANARPPHA